MYLGIQLPANLSALYNRIFLAELRTIRQDLQRWDRSTTPWFGRSSIIKMTILPRLIYRYKHYRYGYHLHSLRCTSLSVEHSLGATNLRGYAGQSWSCQKQVEVLASLTFSATTGWFILHGSLTGTYMPDAKDG